MINLLRRIRPALDKVYPRIEPGNSRNPAFVDAVARENVLLAMGEIRKNPDIKKKFDSGAIALVGGVYDVKTGEVGFSRISHYGERPVGC